MHAEKALQADTRPDIPLEAVIFRRVLDLALREPIPTVAIPRPRQPVIRDAERVRYSLD
jgi:hypothetical protein